MLIIVHLFDCVGYFVGMMMMIIIVVVEESNYSEYISMEQQNGFKGGPIIVERSEGEWCELCLLSLEELLNLELFIRLFV